MSIFQARRHFIRTVTVGSVLAACGHQSLALGSDAIVQPASPGASAFIDRAFEMRRLAVDKGDQPYGAIIVRDNSIIGQSWSRVVVDQDPTGHAEVAAIRDAARRLGSRHLSGAIMYSTSRPCPMCEAAAYWAGVGGMFYGRSSDDAGAPRLCK